MDGDAGIAVDNFSLRGTSGLSLRSIPMHTLRESGRERPYDLIVLQYGLNVATEFWQELRQIHCRWRIPYWSI